MKDNELFRIVMIAAAFLVMFFIIGISLHSIQNISNANQKHKDKKEGEAIASIIAQTTATTSIWDYLREKESTTAVVVPSEAVDASAPTDDSGALDLNHDETEPTEENPDNTEQEVVSE